MTEAASDVIRVEEDTLRTTSADELIAGSDLTADDVATAEELAAQAGKGRPTVLLTPYQKEIVECQARFICAMICRQGGKTFAAMLRMATKILTHPLSYYVLSRSERQSTNAIAQCAAHLRGVEKILQAKRSGVKTSQYSQQRMRYHRRDGSAFEYRRLQVQTPTGGKGIGLPASPDTVVGISGCVNLDEWGVHKHDRDIYGYIYPVISRRKEYELVGTSTPRGIGSKFHEVMTSPKFAKIFHRIAVDIHSAVAQGLKLYDYEGNLIVDAAGIERLREALGDDDKWASEYLCQFVSDVLNLLTHEMVGQAESLHDYDGTIYEPMWAPITNNQFDPQAENLTRRMKLHPTAKIYIGHDIARVRDLAVIWVDQNIDGKNLWNRGTVVMKNCDFDLQEAILWQFMDLPQCHKAGIDATGMGARTAERAVKRYGSKAVPVNFSATLKDRNGTLHPAKSLIARVIRERHQDRLDRYPIRDEIRDDFLRVKRKAGGSPDSFTYFADHDETGHADIFTGKALSDLVFQELQEYGGRVDGVRLPQPKAAGEPGRLTERPDHSEDDQRKAGEFAGIGSLEH